jgi:hypothetical protein
LHKLKDALKKHGNGQNDPGPTKELELLNLASDKEIELNHPVGVSGNLGDLAFNAA